MDESLTFYDIKSVKLDSLNEFGTHLLCHNEPMTWWSVDNKKNNWLKRETHFNKQKNLHNLSEFKRRD